MRLQQLMLTLLIATCPLLTTPALADDQLDPTDLSAQDIVAKAHAAAGGDTWRNLKTLKLDGNITFHREGRHDQTTHADQYRMLRVMPEVSTDAHLANGMVRFDALQGERTIFQIAFDGEHSYNQRGRLDSQEATERWKSNFGFGIIRFALEPDFSLARMADDTIDGHPCHIVQVTDPSGRLTIFGIDRTSYAIRMVGFDSPQGFHQRIYDDFQRKPGVSFVQPGHVRLYYDGVKTNDIRWTEFTINEPIRRSAFVIDPAE